MFARRYWGSGARAVGSDASGFYSALLATLKANPILVDAFGDTPTTPKFHSNLAPSVELPWLTFAEVTSTPEYSSDGTYIETGTCQISITAGARAQARRLANLVNNALDDAALSFDDGSLMRLRHGRSHSDASKETGKNGTTIYYYQVTEYDYLISRNLPG